jgi:transcriptional antiterminator NusG
MDTPSEETVNAGSPSDATDTTESAEQSIVTPGEVASPSEGAKRAWYVVHCYSGYENKVKKGLEQRIQTEPDLGNLIFRVVVPTEEELDLREGQRKVVQRRVFPGYVLVEMIEYHADEPAAKAAWYAVRNTPGVTGFVSSGDKPAPLREEEVAKILKRMEADQPKVRVTYRPGQVVHIIDGPFADFRGTVDEVNMEKGKVRVMVSFFGRETPVELDLLQVEKV